SGWSTTDDWSTGVLSEGCDVYIDVERRSTGPGSSRQHPTTPTTTPLRRQLDSPRPLGCPQVRLAPHTARAHGGMLRARDRGDPMTATTRVGEAAATAAAGALPLAGCSGEGGEAGPTPGDRVVVEELGLPESLVSGSGRVGQWSVRPQSGELPRLAVTTAAHGRADEADVGGWQGTGVDALAEQAEVAVPGA